MGLKFWRKKRKYQLVEKNRLTGEIYVVFIVGGAGCALASTLNNQLATTPKPIMQMCDDGWLPQSLADLNKKNVPWKIQLILYVIGVVCVVSGLSISMLSNMCILSTGVTTIVMNISTARLPKLVPNAWAKSKFGVSQGVLNVLCGVSALASTFNVYLNASSLSKGLLLFNVAIIGASFVFGIVKGKSVHMDVSYEEI